MVRQVLVRVWISGLWPPAGANFSRYLSDYQLEWSSKIPWGQAMVRPRDHWRRIRRDRHSAVPVWHYQRQLLRMLLRNFDFLFSMVQILILGVLFCDMSHWDIDRVLLYASWTLWFLWALSLDAVTPMIRHQVLGISRNIAIPVLLTMFIACINGTYKVTVMPFVFYNRTLWHHILSPTRSISITTFDLFYGRVLTIVLWCSRQVYRLMTRAPNELYLLHGHVDLVLKEEPRDSPRLAQIHPSEGPRKASTWATKSHSNEQAKCPGT